MRTKIADEETPQNSTKEHLGLHLRPETQAFETTVDSRT